MKKYDLSAQSSKKRIEIARDTAEFLKKQVNKKGMIDVSNGVEHELGISKEKLKEALHILNTEGYLILEGNISQITDNKKRINIKILCPPQNRICKKEYKNVYTSFQIS